jgi:hypothetical protein
MIDYYLLQLSLFDQKYWLHCPEKGVYQTTRALEWAQFSVRIVQQGSQVSIISTRSALESTKSGRQMEQ